MKMEQIYKNEHFLSTVDPLGILDPVYVKRGNMNKTSMLSRIKQRIFIFIPDLLILVFWIEITLLL